MPTPRRSFALGATVLGALALGAGQAAAGPNGATIAGHTGGAGAQGAVIAGEGTADVTITQDASRVLIQWNDFDVAPGEAVRFEQQSADWIALNRVVGGGGPTTIDGEISAIGQVWIVDPAGINVGFNAPLEARIDVGGLVLSTADIADADFLDGNGQFAFVQAAPSTDVGVFNNATGGGEGGVRTTRSVSAGDDPTARSIAAQGLAALVAPNVGNEGRIVATAGTIILAGTEVFTLDFRNDGLLSFAMPPTVMVTRTVGQSGGSLSAPGGRVLIGVNAIGDALDSVINVGAIDDADLVEIVVRGSDLTLGDQIVGDGSGEALFDDADFAGFPAGASVSISGDQNVNVGFGVDSADKSIDFVTDERAIINIDAAGAFLAGGAIAKALTTQGANVALSAETLDVPDLTFNLDGGDLRLEAAEFALGSFVSAKPGGELRIALPEDADLTSTLRVGLPAFAEVRDGTGALVIDGTADIDQAELDAINAGGFSTIAFGVAAGAAEGPFVDFAGDVAVNADLIAETDGDLRVFGQILNSVASVTLIAGGAVVTDQLIDTKTGDFSVTAGSISLVGPLSTVGGDATLVADGAVTLDAMALGGGDLSVTADSVAFNGAVTGVGAFALAARAATQDPTTAITAASLAVETRGGAADAFVLPGANTVGALTFAPGAAFAPAPLTLGLSSGDALANAASSLTVSGASSISAAGPTTLAAVIASSGDLALAATGPDGGLTVATAPVVAGALDLFAGADLMLPPGGLVAGGDAFLSAVGAISTGTITVGGGVVASAGAGIGAGGALTLGDATPDDGLDVVAFSDLGPVNLTLTGVPTARLSGLFAADDATATLTTDGALVVLSDGADAGTVDITADTLSVEAPIIGRAGETVLLTVDGLLTVASPISSAGPGDAIVITAGSFVNTFGAGALDPGLGRFLVYSDNPATDARGGVVENDQKRYGFTFADNPPSTIAEPGDLFFYAFQPTLDVVADNLRYFAGAFPPLGFTPDESDLIDGDTLADALAGAPTLSTAAQPGAPAGTYPILLGIGGLTSPVNYLINPVDGVATVIAGDPPRPVDRSRADDQRDGTSASVADLAAPEVVRAEGLTLRARIDASGVFSNDGFRDSWLSGAALADEADGDR